MKTKTEMILHIGQTMGRVGMKRLEIMQAIAKHNKVSVETVYRWISSEDPMSYGRIEGSLEAIEKKGAKL